MKSGSRRLLNDRRLASRHPFELLEVGLPFLDEGVFALLGFFAHVVEEGGVAGEVEEAHLAIAIGIERGFEAAES